MRPNMLILVVVMIGFALSCKKDPVQPTVAPADSTNSGNVGGGTKGGSLAFANGDYVGTIIEYSRFYPKPIDLRFNADSTVWAYCLFYIKVGGSNYSFYDSLEGKVVNVTTGSGGALSTTVYYKATADTQIYNFSADLSTVSGGSNGLAPNQWSFSGLVKAPATPFVLNPSFWRADGNYGDVDGVQFTTYQYSDIITGNVTEFFENGNWLNTGPTGIPPGRNYAFGYLQMGSRVYFDGYQSASSGLFAGVPYYGVIMPDGKTILADTKDFADAHLPTDPTETDFGNTPEMVRKIQAAQTACTINGYSYGSETVSVSYNPDTTFSEIINGSLDVKYQYAGDSVVMVTSGGGTPLGRVVVNKNASGQPLSLATYVLDASGAVKQWQNYAYTYVGAALWKVQRTSSFNTDPSNGEYDYSYSSGNLLSITFNQQAFLNFGYDILTPEMPGDVWWIQADIDLSLAYQLSKPCSAFMNPVHNRNVCTQMNTLPSTYVYDDSGKITSGSINNDLVTYTYNCP